MTGTASLASEVGCHLRGSSVHQTQPTGFDLPTINHSHEVKLFLAATGVRLNDWKGEAVHAGGVSDIELLFPTRSRWAKEIELSRRLAASLPHDHGSRIAFIGKDR